jgi:S-formylglutathione hydrolase FrmB
MTEYWRTIQIDGKSADVFEPPDAVPERAVVFLHGHGGATLLGNEVYTAEFAKHKLRVICPHGGKSWWTPFISEEFDDQISPIDFLLNNVADWIKDNWATVPPNIAIAGVSMGGQGAVQLSYRHARKYPAVVAISPIVDFDRLWGNGLPLDDIFDTQEAARQASPILHLHPLNWPRYQLICCDPADEYWFDGTQRLASKLYSTGIAFDSDFESTGGGHTWEYFDSRAPKVVEFLAKSLESESLRLI